MKANGWLATALLLTASAALSGCLVPQSELTTAQSQNRILAEQSRAQLAEIDNLKAHGRDVENQLIRTEQEMAALEEQVDLDRKRLANYKQETTQLHDQFKSAVGAGRLPAAVSEQLADLSRRYPSLSFDPVTGIGKVDTDVLFDSGQAELKPAAQAMLGQLSRILQTQAAGELKVMVVGHTDSQRLAGQAVRERYSSNFHLSTALPWRWPTSCAARGSASGDRRGRLRTLSTGRPQQRARRSPEEPPGRDLRHGPRRAGGRLDGFRPQRLLSFCCGNAMLAGLSPFAPRK